MLGNAFQMASVLKENAISNKLVYSFNFTYFNVHN